MATVTSYDERGITIVYVFPGLSIAKCDKLLNFSFFDMAAIASPPSLPGESEKQVQQRIRDKASQREESVEIPPELGCLVVRGAHRCFGFLPIHDVRGGKHDRGVHDDEEREQDADKPKAQEL